VANSRRSATKRIPEEIPLDPIYRPVPHSWPRKHLISNSAVRRAAYRTGFPSNVELPFLVKPFSRFHMLLLQPFAVALDDMSLSCNFHFEKRYSARSTFKGPLSSASTIPFEILFLKSSKNSTIKQNLFFLHHEIPAQFLHMQDSDRKTKLKKPFHEKGIAEKE